MIGIAGKSAAQRMRRPLVGARRAPEAEIRSAALQAGMQFMRDDGQRLVAGGVTSLQELVRVTRD